MAFDLVPENRKLQVTQFLRSKGMDCSVYGAQFFLDALYKSGNEDHALSLLTSTGKRSWYNMIAQGATMSMEAWDNAFKPNQDWNHAWGSVPANIIMRKLVGIESVKPGFEEIDIRPQIGNLSFISADLPTIKGNIQIRIENKVNQYGMNLSLPGNTRANIYLPLKFSGKRVSLDGKAVNTIIKDNTCYLSSVGSGDHKLLVEWE
jgi:alpha-L-rhamnosidase